MAAKRPKKIRATWDFRDPKSDRKLGPHGFQKSKKCQLTQPRFGPPLKFEFLTVSRDVAGFQKL